MRSSEVAEGLSEFGDQDSYVQLKPAGVAATTNVKQLWDLVVHWKTLETTKPNIQIEQKPFVPGLVNWHNRLE